MKLLKVGGKEYSKDTGCGDKVKQMLIGTLDKMDENFDMNASKKGTLAISKEEYKNNFIDTISNLDDIVYADMKDKNQYTLYFEENPKVGGVYTTKQIKNKLGTIPGNIILLPDEENAKIPYAYTMLHEGKHPEQEHKGDSDTFVTLYEIMAMLKEGNANNNAEYMRDIKLSKRGAITKVSESENDGYKLFSVIYNKLLYLVGEKEMDKYIEEQKVDLLSFLSEKLDTKYGVGTGLNIYQHITNLSLWATSYTGKVSIEKIDNIMEEIKWKDDFISWKMWGQCSESEYEELSNAMTINDNYYKMLKTIKNKVQGKCKKDEDIEKLTIDERNKELEALEKLTLKCINKDIEKISNKNETLDYIKLWDYYRNRCSISKNIYNTIEFLVGEEETSKEENFELLSKVQHNLYEKCTEYGALNIQNEEIFNKLIESQLYDLENASIRYENDTKAESGINNKVIISDQYLTNEFAVFRKGEKGKDYKLIFSYQYLTDKLFVPRRENNIKDNSFYNQYEGRLVGGTKILAEREKEKEQGK